MDIREFITISIIALIVFLFADATKTYFFVSDLQATSSTETIELLSPLIAKMMDGVKFETVAGIILLILLGMFAPSEKEHHH